MGSATGKWKRIIKKLRVIQADSGREWISVFDWVGVCCEGKEGKEAERMAEKNGLGG